MSNVRQGFSEKLGEVQSRLGQAEELLKSGLESEGAVGGAYIASKTGLKAYRYFKGTHDLQGNLTDAGKAAANEAGNTTAQEGSSVADNMGGRVARPNNPNSNEEFESGQGQEMRSQEMVTRNSRLSSNQYTRDGQDPDTGLRTRPQPDPATGETKENFSPNEDGYGDIAGDAGDAAESAGNAARSAASTATDLAGDAGEAASSAASSASTALSGAADGASSAASGLADAVTTAASTATDAALDSAAAAFSWVPFLGEILGGAAAIAGIGTAIAGGVETAEETAKENATQAQAASGIAKAAAARPVNNAMNYAGGYVAPAASSIQT